METWTIQKLLTWITAHFTEKNIDAPRLSAELLLSHILALKRIELYTQFNRVVEKEQLSRLHELVKRAAGNEPIAYLTGKKEFYSLEFEITKDCLIPRPETELLVERAVEFLRSRNGEQLVCDLCTGCACVAVAIGTKFANCKILATDISDTALSVAEKNVVKYGLQNRLKLLRGDLFEPIVPDPVKFDLIVCNPPYVSQPQYENLPKNVKDFEPKQALLAGTDGLDLIKKIIASAGAFLKPAAALMLEIADDHGPAVRKLLEDATLYENISIEKDYSGRDRLAIAFVARASF
jgi:release factor glutamine methyltransferase